MPNTGFDIQMPDIAKFLYGPYIQSGYRIINSIFSGPFLSMKSYLNAQIYIGCLIG